MSVDISESLRKAYLGGVIERLGQQLDLTETQRQTAEDRYKAVGAWISGSDDPILRTATIYAHGSFALGTINKPLSYDEYDVDLACLIAGLSSSCSAAALKGAFGNRLKENARYARIVEEKQRCWRLNFGGEFHMDVPPSIPNAACMHEGERVPNKKLREWKPTNPKGYRRWFEQRAGLQPRMRQRFADQLQKRADIEPFPEYRPLQGILRRSVQIAKRHRDIYFLNLDPSLAPISIIITTLAAQSYAFCVRQFEFDSELDVLSATIRLMPTFVQIGAAGGRRQWFVPNETTNDENFAEKWNQDAKLATAFYDWHAAAVSTIDTIIAMRGLDHLSKGLGEAFGHEPVTRVIDSITHTISSARSAGRLVVAPSVGLAVASIPGATVRSNTFYGAG